MCEYRALTIGLTDELFSSIQPLLTANKMYLTPALTVRGANILLTQETFHLLIVDNANPHSSDAGIHAASYGGLWQCVVQGFGGLRMLGGKLRISPNLPKAWNKLSYTLLWKGQKLAVTVTPEMVKIVNQTSDTPITLEVWGQEYTIEQELVLPRKSVQ